MGKLQVRDFLRPPSRHSKTFCAPSFKEWKVCVPPFNMATTLSYHVKTTPKLCVLPPSAWLQLFPPPSPVTSPLVRAGCSITKRFVIYQIERVDHET